MNKEVVAFVIPLKPKSKSGNWEEDCKVLNKTLASLINQCSPNFKAYVIYTDIPVIIINDPRIHYIEFPYGFQEFAEIPEKEQLLKLLETERMVVRRWDKGRKVTYGSKLAFEANCSYIMSLDADDLVSNRLVAYIEKNCKNASVPGWVIDKGYVYKESTNYLLRIPQRLHYINGSTIILHKKLIRIPDFSSAEYLDYNLFTDHAWVYDRIQEEYAVSLEFVAFPAVIYFVHENNVSKVDKTHYGFSFKNVVKRILRGTRLSTKLRDEFSLTTLLLSFQITIYESVFMQL